MKKFYIFSSLILILFIIFFNCQQASDSGGSSRGGSDDTIEISFKKRVDSTDNVGWFTSVAVDGSNVYISYYDFSHEDLKLARSTDSGNTWDSGNIKTVDSINSVGKDASMAVNGSNVYISYFDETNGNLKFARSTDSGNTWDSGNIKTVDSVGYVGLYTSIAVDGSSVYISYYDYTNEDLKFAKSADGGNTWDSGNIKTVDSIGNVGLYTSIAVNGSNVYISYFGETHGDLKVAKSADSGNTWNPRVVDSTGIVGKHTSIAVDSSSIYISYFDETNGNLKFARSTDSGNTWDSGNIKTVDSVGYVGFYTSIAVDGSNVYISYYDITNEDLKFAKSADGGNTWDSGNIKTVDSADNVGWFTSIAVDGSNVYISYFDFTNRYLKFARSVDRGNTW